MPTQKPRISLTLDPETASLPGGMAQLVRQSTSSLAEELILGALERREDVALAALVSYVALKTGLQSSIMTPGTELYKATKLHIKKAIERQLQTDPIGFGEPLRYSLQGYKRLRVGEHRIAHRTEAKQP